MLLQNAWYSQNSHALFFFATFLFCSVTLNPVIGLILVGIFFVLVAGSHFVSLGSIVTAAFYPILLSSFDQAYTQYGVGTIFALFLAALVAWSHRTNIRRLLDHTERKTYFFKKPDGADKKDEKDNT